MTALLRAHPAYASRRDLREMLDDLLNPGEPDRQRSVFRLRPIDKA